MPAKSTNKKQRDIYKFLNANKGKFVQITAVIFELTSKDVLVTRETVRKWFTAYGCKHVGGGVYRVPEAMAPTIPTPAPEPEPQGANHE